MKKTKLSLTNLQGKLSRAEMKKIMAGYDDIPCPSWCGHIDPIDSSKTVNGTCSSQQVWVPSMGSIPGGYVTECVCSKGSSYTC